MDEKLTSKEESTPLSNDLDNIPRCLECNLISSLQLFYKEGSPIIKYSCENDHKGDIPLDEYIQKYNTHSLLKEKCEECNKNQNEVKGDYFYCCKCNKFLCHSCVLNHPNNENHNTFNFKRYDSFCKNHCNSFDTYCKKCRKNLCIYCKPEHKSHEIIDLNEINYYKESKNKLENQINNIENKIKDLDIIKEEIISEIDKLKKRSEMEMNFFKILISASKYEESQNNMNFNIIQNIKNFEEKIIGLDKGQTYEKIFKEGKKYISFLEKCRQNSDESSIFKNNFKTLKNHTDTVLHLSQLKDGRLISSSCDCALNIYKKDTFELQLSIKEHSNYVRYFTQLKDERIISCSDDKTINIIKLIDEDKYNLEQKLKGHTSNVCNLIEIKENELISVSCDKTMKKWEIKNEKKFECTKTINFQNSASYCNILKINENEFVTSSFTDKCLKFWNSNDFSNIATINNIETESSFRTLCILKEDILCAGGKNSKGFYLINISNHQLIKNILGPQEIYSIYECFDGSLLCSIKNENGNCALAKYNYENEDMKKIVEKEKIHEGIIYTCFELNDGIIASGGSDRLIKLWRN